MSWISKWIEGGKEWLLRIALQKVLKRIIQIVIAFLASSKLKDLGIEVDQEKATIAIYAGIEIVRNFLKTKFGWKFL